MSGNKILSEVIISDYIKIIEIGEIVDNMQFNRINLLGKSVNMSMKT